MTRDKLPPRRFCITRHVVHPGVEGKEFKVNVTFGLDRHGRVREVFCADFKAGSELFAAVMDACVMMSRLMQHGMSPRELLTSLGSPPSLYGSIIKAAIEIDDFTVSQYQPPPKETTQ